MKRMKMMWGLFVDGVCLAITIMMILVVCLMIYGAAVRALSGLTN